jgi:AAA domain
VSEVPGSPFYRPPAVAEPRTPISQHVVPVVAGGGGAPSRGRGVTWGPVSLGPVLDGTYTPPVPTIGSRDDGTGLFYPGRQHSVAGETESGKSMLMLAQAEVELRRGNCVVYVDFEDDEGGVVGRLLALGAKPDAIRDRFAYLRPEEPLGALGNRDDLRRVLGDLRPSLAVLDGITEAMTLHALDPLSNRDAATFARLLPRFIAGHGPAVVALDHVTKSPEGRGRYALGAAHKLNGLTGTALLIENRSPFGVGITGRSTVVLVKDRPGQVRRHGVPTGGGGTWLGDFVLESHDETFIEASFTAPADHHGGETWRPTVLMGKVSAALGRAGQPLTVRGILDRVTGTRDEHVRAALAALVDDGYVAVENGPRGAHLHRLVRPFPEDAA